MLIAWAATLFLSAALLLVVQPMVSRAVLPLLGGGAAVWTTCMLFFQVALLLGYLHAHAGPRLLGLRRHAAIHVALLAASLLLLPLDVSSAGMPDGAAPVPWLLALLAASVGIPFVLVATTGPLLQRWFAESGHPSAGNPYFLYSASNAGSLLALLAYPVLVEPLLPLATQRAAWSAGYAILAAAVLACALLLRRSARIPTAAAVPSDVPALVAHTAPASPIRWVVYAFIPSGLMLGVTTHVTTDIAPVPLLWVVPLALYLLSFVLAFARRPRPPHAFWVRIQPLLLAVTAVGLFFGERFVVPAFIPFHLLAFFVTAMVCHGELVRLAPPPARLTEFYLLISVGGALGGFFCAVVAPLLFRSVAEYPILIALAALVRPAGEGEWRRRGWAEIALTVSVAALAGVMLARRGAAFKLEGAGAALAWTALALGCAVVVLLLVTRGDRWRFALTVGALLVFGAILPQRTSRVVFADRNFYGAREVRDDGYRLLLVHGSTLHGLQRKGERSGEPTSYYDRRGPLGDVFRVRPAAPVRVAVAGLGTGALAAYGRMGDRFDFYEIDPAMVRLARDGGWFTFLRRSLAEISIVVGDARLRLADAPDGAYDVIVLDAFASDAIPFHLITREAIAGYVAKLAPRGMIALHLSNRYLDLVPVVAALEEELGLAGRVRATSQLTTEQLSDGMSGSTWAVLARDESSLRSLARSPAWRDLETKPGVRAWTDDYSNVFRVFRMR